MFLCLFLLCHLRNQLGRKELTMIADGLMMSKIRYCFSVYGVEWLRLNENDPRTNMLSSLQKIQNSALRIITGSKRVDHVRVTDMLKATNFLSVNQVIAYSTLMEMWKARAFNVPVLESLLDRVRNDDRTLRSDSQQQVKYTPNEYFARAAAQLWNRASDRFRNTNLTVIAKKEAKLLVSTLPI